MPFRLWTRMPRATIAAGMMRSGTLQAPHLGARDRTPIIRRRRALPAAEAVLLLLEGGGDLLFCRGRGARAGRGLAPPRRALRASSASSTSVFLLMAESWRSRSSPSETAIVSMAESLSACSWIDPAVLSNTLTAPSMLYSSVIGLHALLGVVHGVDGLELAELADLALDPLLLDLELGAGVVGPRLGRLERLLGALAGGLGLDLELQRAPGQLLVARPSGPLRPAAPGS